MPIGVCGAIVPWNFPLTLAANKVAPAIAAGNTVVLKPASTTPLSTLACIEALIEGGLPEGVVNVVLGTATGEAMVDHPLIRKIALTGSTPTGQKVMARAAEGLKKITLERGGSDPCIVLDDADLEAVVEGIKIGGFFNAGQDCTAATRVIAGPKIFDRLLGGLVPAVESLKVGDPKSADAEMGPLVSEEQAERVTGFGERARTDGRAAGPGQLPQPRRAGGRGPRSTTNVGSHGSAPRPNTRSRKRPGDTTGQTR